MKSSLFLFFLIYVCYAAPFRNRRKSKGKEFFSLGTCRDVEIPGLFTPEILYTYKRDIFLDIPGFFVFKVHSKLTAVIYFQH